MPYKEKYDRAAYQRRHYLKNTEAVKKKAKDFTIKARKRNSDFLFECKNGKVCTDCSISYPPCVMEFDHKAKDKRANVSDLASRGASIKNLEKEILKCDLVCANCHRIRTFNRKHEK